MPETDSLCQRVELLYSQHPLANPGPELRIRHVFPNELRLQRAPEFPIAAWKLCNHSTRCTVAATGSATMMFLPPDCGILVTVPTQRPNSKPALADSAQRDSAVRPSGQDREDGRGAGNPGGSVRENHTRPQNPRHRFRRRRVRREQCLWIGNVPAVAALRCRPFSPSHRLRHRSEPRVTGCHGRFAFQSHLVVQHYRGSGTLGGSIHKSRNPRLWARSEKITG